MVIAFLLWLFRGVLCLDNDLSFRRGLSLQKTEVYLGHLINQAPPNHGLLPVFVNEGLLEYSHAVYICDCVGITVAKLGGCQRGHSILKAQNTA